MTIRFFFKFLNIFVPFSFGYYTAYTIDCFKCVSNNGGNKACDDPFHNNESLTILESPCMGGRKGRDGLFPATSCIKIAGYFGKKIVTYQFIKLI